MYQISILIIGYLGYEVSVETIRTVVKRNMKVLKKELEREEYIKRKGYKLIRFNPDSEESIFKLINRVFMECQTA